MDSKINAKLLAECCHIVNLAGGDSYKRGQYAMAVLREYRRREIGVEQPVRAQNTDGGMNQARWEHVLQDARLNKQLLGVLLEFLVNNAVLYHRDETNDGIIYGVRLAGAEQGTTTGRRWEIKA